MSESRHSILVVEDDPILAMDIESTLARGGYSVHGVAISTREAFELLRERTPHLAILDINLGEEVVFPVADYLADAGIPFLILSGHSRALVPVQHRSRPFLQKPYAAATLLRAIRALLADIGDRGVEIQNAGS